MTSEYQERLREIRTKYPKAYERWSEHDDNLLGRKSEAGASVEELSELFQRQPGAIRSRLRKLGFSTDSKGRKKTSTSIVLRHRNSEETGLTYRGQCGGVIDVRFSFEWKAVWRDECEEYLFPEQITDFMKCLYGCTAVYRWSVHRSGQTYPQSIYIGSTKRLCPDRLEGYLNPRTSITNRRLNEEFHRCLQQSAEIHLEILHISKVVIGDIVLTSCDLSANNTRLSIENLLIAYYRQKGFTLLNL